MGQQIDLYLDTGANALVAAGSVKNGVFPNANPQRYLHAPRSPSGPGQLRPAPRHRHHRRQPKARDRLFGRKADRRPVQTNHQHRHFDGDFFQCDDSSSRHSYLCHRRQLHCDDVRIRDERGVGDHCRHRQYGAVLWRIVFHAIPDQLRADQHLSLIHI